MAIGLVEGFLPMLGEMLAQDPGDAAAAILVGRNVAGPPRGREAGLRVLAREMQLAEQVVEIALEIVWWQRPRVDGCARELVGRENVECLLGLVEQASGAERSRGCGVVGRDPEIERLLSRPGAIERLDQACLGLAV